MINLLDLPNFAWVLIGKFVALETLVANAQSRARVAEATPLTEPFWRGLCRALGVRSSLEHEQPWSKWLLLYVLPFRRAVVVGDFHRLRRLRENFRGPGPVSRYEVPASTLRDALMIDDPLKKLCVLRVLFEFGTAPDAVNDLGEALVSHARDFEPDIEGTYIHIFRAIAYHLGRWNITITAFQYVQARYYTLLNENMHWRIEIGRVPVPPAAVWKAQEPLRMASALTLMDQGRYEELRSFLGE